jgi:hypothetical protein
MIQQQYQLDPRQAKQVREELRVKSMFYIHLRLFESKKGRRVYSYTPLLVPGSI